MDATLALLALAVALALRPWRCWGREGPCMPWLATAAALPVLWALGAAGPLVQPLSGAALLVLLAGWPFAVLAPAAVALGLWMLGEQSGALALQRWVWAGLLPATLMLALGAPVRRWLPRHLLSYVLGRGVAATLLACFGAGFAAVALRRSPGSDWQELLWAQALVASGEALLTGLAVGVLALCRPQCLATYSARLYALPR
ncbi:MAG: hypothetical protein QM702_24355 [Rubrivivax sp.]